MTTPLRRYVADALARPIEPDFAGFARAVAAERSGVAVLFYGSVLRTGDRDGMLDFYVLTEERRKGATARLWPDISFAEHQTAAGTLRAKVATMPLDAFVRAAAGRSRDTTIWTRFVQPAALAWARDDAVCEKVERAVADAAMTAARYAAVLGPHAGSAEDYWRALFRETYRAEFRIEPRGRNDVIVDHDPQHYAALLPLAWEAARIDFGRHDVTLSPRVEDAERKRLRAGWRRVRRWGKPLNAARLVKAAFLLDGAARYGAWKVERHTGVRVAMTPWREAHPLLAAPGVLWRVWRARRAG